MFLVCTVIWLVSGAQGQFWPIWAALVALIPLLRNGWRLYGPAPELDQVERDLDSRQRRGEHRHRFRDEVRGEALSERAARHHRRRDR